MARLLDQAPAAATLPAFDIARMDDLENLWLRRYPLPDATQQDWIVFDHGGIAIGRVVLPASTELLTVTRERVIVSHRDDLGIERVLVFDLGPLRISRM